MDRGAWWATVHGVTKSQTRLSDSTTSLALNHSELKAPTVCPYEENIHSLLLPASLREGDQASVHCPSGHFSRPALPRFGTRGWFPGRRFLPGLGCRGWEWFGEDSNTGQLLCTLFLLSHQLYLRSSGIRSWSLRTSALDYWEHAGLE